MTENQEDYPQHEDLLAILRAAPHRPRVRILVRVVNEDTGEVVQEETFEDAELWDRGYRQYYKIQKIRETADHVAARIAYDDDNRRGRA